jgi:hypothetical protein
MTARGYKQQHTILARVNSAWFAQDCAYCFWQAGQSYSTQLGYFIPPILNEPLCN